MATGLTGEEQKAVAEFRAQVVEPSMEKLVILDFYADWCGPCKAIAPMLEKIAAEYADKGVIVEKIDVDKNKFVASQFQVQSIPTIFAIFQGQPIANLTQARTESQMKQVIDQLLAKLPIVARSAADGAEDVAPLVAMAQELMEQGDMERALGIFAQLSEMAPENDEVITGFLRCLLANGHIDEAQKRFDALDDDRKKLPEMAQFLSQLKLAQDMGNESGDDAAQAAEREALLKQLSDSPDDHDVRFDLANILYQSGDRDGAAEHLLAIIAADKNWGEGKAKEKLLTIFEAIGLEDPWVAATRRKLAAAIFG